MDCIEWDFPVGQQLTASFESELEQSVPATKTISKRATRQRTLGACEPCRHSKKRCDGLYPCKRCQSTNRACAYLDSRARRSPPPPITDNEVSFFTPSPPPSLQVVRFSPTNSLLSEEAIERSYISLFFRQLYPMERVIGIDLSNFDRPQSKPILLQYYTAMASATRVFARDPTNVMHLNYERRARQLASELFDHVDIETALGLHLLSRHMLSYDLEQAEHLRDMSSSMCHRIQRRGGLEMATRARLLRLEMINIGIRRFYQPFGSDSETKRLITLAESTTDDTGFLRNILDLHHFGANFRSILQVDSEDFPDDHSISFRSISPDELHSLSKLLDQKVSLIVHRLVAPPNQIGLTLGALSMLRAVLLFAGGQTQGALVLLHQVIEVLESNSHFWSQTSPHLPDLIHVCFLVAYLSKDYDLASKMNGIQHRLLEFFPSTIGDCLHDQALLSSLPPADDLDDLLLPLSPSHEKCEMVLSKNGGKASPVESPSLWLNWPDNLHSPSFEEMLLSSFVSH